MPERIKWFEIDFPNNLEYKCNLLEKRNNYFAVPGDLRDMKIVENSLITVGLDTKLKTFIISEVVLAYLSEEHSTNVIKWVSETFRKNLFLEFEMINPTSTFGNFMVKHFTKLGKVDHNSNT